MLRGCSWRAQPGGVCLPILSSCWQCVSPSSCLPSSSSLAPQEKPTYFTFKRQGLLPSTLLLQVQIHLLFVLASRTYLIPSEPCIAWETYNSPKTRFLCYNSEARDGRKKRDYTITNWKELLKEFFSMGQSNFIISDPATERNNLPITANS